MLTVCFTLKGGQGCSVAAGLLAFSGGPNVVAVDASEDLCAVLGLGDSDALGIVDFALGELPLDQLPVSREAGVAYVRTGRGPAANVPEARWRELGRMFAADSHHYIVDAGSTPARVMAEDADDALLVTRQCYLALRHAVRSPIRPSGVISINEPGRALGRQDIERVVGAPVVLEIPFVPEISRAVDAGLMHVSRLPGAARRALRRRVHLPSEPADSPMTTD